MTRQRSYIIGSGLDALVEQMPHLCEALSLTQSSNFLNKEVLYSVKIDSMKY